MQHLTRWTRVIFFTTLAVTLTAAAALSQSGRGRPKVPQPSSTTAAPANVSVPAATVVIKQEQAGTISRFVLHNGITVVINEQHATPIVASVAAFKAGPAGDWGTDVTQTLIERLILKGHAQLQLREIGAKMEADDSQGCTSYFVLTSPAKLREAVTAQADLLQNPTLDEGAIRKEIGRAIEETRSGGAGSAMAGSFSAFSTRTLTPHNALTTPFKSIDDPASASMSRLIDIAFGGANASIADAMRPISNEQLLESYRNRYRPENLIVSVVGDVSTFETLVSIQQVYGTFGETAQTTDKNAKVGEAAKRPTLSAQKSRKDPSPGETVETQKPVQPAESKPAPSAAPDKLRYAADRGDITQSLITVGFRVPGLESRDSAAIEVLAALLGQGRGSRLNRYLIDGQMAANRIEARYVAQQKTGLLAIQIWSPADSREGSSIDKAESALFKALDTVRHETPAEGELVRAKTVIEKRFVDDNETYLGRAIAFARAEAGASGFRSAIDFRARIRAVSGADVQRIAAAHLTIANTSIHEYEPLTAAPRNFDSDTFTRTVTSWAPGFAQPVDSASVQPADPRAAIAPVAQGSDRSPEQRALLESVQPLPVKDFSTLNGPKAFVREDHSQPKVTIAILFQGGRVIEDESTSGTTELMLRSIQYGTPRRTFPQVTDELEQLGADVGIVAEPDFFGFVVSVLSRNAERALKLVRDEIEEPAFRDEDVVRAKRGQVAAIREARDLPISRSHEMLLQALFPGHPYALPPHGREEIIAALTSDKIREWHSRVIKRQLPIAIVVGDTDGSALVSGQVAEGFKRRELDTAIQLKAPNIVSGGEKTEQRPTDQTTIAIGVGGPKAESRDLTALQVIEAAMNFESGPLLLELRDKQNLISNGALDEEELFVAGIMWAWAITSPENEQRTRGALRAQLEVISRDGMAPNQLAGARALTATAQLAQFQSQTQHALQYAEAIFRRRALGEVDDVDRMSKVSSDDIKRAASIYLKVATSSTAVVRGAASQPPAPQTPKQN